MKLGSSHDEGGRIVNEAWKRSHDGNDVPAWPHHVEPRLIRASRRTLMKLYISPLSVWAEVIQFILPFSSVNRSPRIGDPTWLSSGEVDKSEYPKGTSIFRSDKGRGRRSTALLVDSYSQNGLQGSVAVVSFLTIDFSRNERERNKHQLSH